MAKKNDLIDMWRADMEQCATDLEATLTKTVNELNKCKSARKPVQQTVEEQLAEVEPLRKEFERMNKQYEGMNPMKDMTDKEIAEVMANHFQFLAEFENKFFKQKKK